MAFVFGLFTSTTQAQDPFEWWNTTHNWDGVTHWTRYLIISPAFMGPNALPVPEMNQARISNELSFEARGDVHWGKGDRTQNLFTRLYVPLAKSRVGVEMFYVPIEWYRLSPETRDARRAREQDAEGVAAGDVYFGTTIQVVSEARKPSWPSISVGMFAKTASGTHLFNARYTDAPGYYFDAQVGKDLLRDRPKAQLRLYGMVGFYVWQTYSTVFLQNDAFSFGAGASLRHGSWQFTQDLAGYIGYIDNGDKPLVARSVLAYRFPRFTYQLRYQAGLHDFPFHTLGLSIIYRVTPGFLD